MSDSHRFKLYIAALTPGSGEIIEKVRNFLDEQLADRYDLTVICLMDEPHLADDDNIFATPTLVRVSPKPSRRVVGNMTYINRLLVENRVP